MSVSELRPHPQLSNAEHVLTAGATVAIFAGVISLVSWAAAGAPLTAYSSAATAAMSAFAAGAGIRALGGLITRFSRRVAVILLGDVGAILIGAAVVLAVGAIHDSSGSGLLTVVTTLGFLLPAVVVLSPVVTLLARNAAARRVLFTLAALLFLVALTGYGASFWR
ncbi:hypothetical protein LVJ59_10870 [Microbacterium sp. KKR3/1]|uniref:hypothetical protein n=1 Tax=Microbacterium sp. KKR3/1 TaxID=2904241 RepID=UPI001E3FF627|nr:hypothetical protein [Microbacterium sp. KKR3/1]MCE0509545.1 hypothetical protein [Microbacterium sp. KKR3/1]